MSGQILNTLAEELAALCAGPVSDADRSRAALHVLDWAGCAVAGSNSEQARHFRAAVRDDFRGRCTAIGAQPAGALGAVMINGALGNVLEMDDVDKRAVLHPGPVVIPAALAACESAGGDASAFLDAIVRGYEAVIRVGRAGGGRPLCLVAQYRHVRAVRRGDGGGQRAGTARGTRRARFGACRHAGQRLLADPP